MATIFENYKDQLGTAGYFQIGDVSLVIPPEDILTSNVNNDDEITILRAKYPMLVKTGQARLDASVQWKSLLTVKNGAVDYTQWEDLRRIVAIFRCAPIVEIENEHIRSILAELDQSMKVDRMAFALRQLRISTVPDMSDALQVSLDMTLFNYLPYSKDFAYGNSDGSKVGAIHSDKFPIYVDTWMSENMYPQDEAQYFTDWHGMDPDNTNLQWFTYIAQPRQTTDPITKIPRTDNQVSDPSEWTYDYTTDSNTLFYKANELAYTAGEYAQSDTGVYPTGVSVVLVNNLAQIPLANYQYPTYQHVGASPTMVSVAFQTDGADSVDSLGDLSSMVTSLNSTFLQLRSVARKVSSLHKMQAVFVRNQILNMLGIYSMLLRGFRTQTVKESTHVEAALFGLHYENMFEEVGPYRIKSPSQAYSSAVQQAAMSPSVVGSLTGQDKQLAQPLVDYYNGQQNLDPNYLKQKIGSLDSSTISAVASMPSVPLPTSIPRDPALGIWSILNQPVNPTTSQPLSVSAPAALSMLGGNSAKTVGSYYPALAQAAAQNAVPTYTQVFLLEAIAQQNGIVIDPSVQSLINQIDTAAAAQNPSPLAQFYNWIYTSQAQNNGAFSQSLQAVSQMPAFQSALNGAVQQGGPANDPDNAGHGAYNDLGLKAITQSGQDFNPAYYFYDYSQDLWQSMWNNSAQTIGNFYQAFSQTNNPGNSAAQITPADSGLGPNNPYGLMIRSNLTGLSMSAAFPTFKLFLMEDCNGSIFYAFDDFYSYASVKDIEVIRYRDQPDTARICLTNMAGLLSRKLFDLSTDGRREQELYLDQFGQGAQTASPTASNGGALTDPGGIGTPITGARNPVTGVNYIPFKGSTDDNTVPSPNDPNNFIPLKYYPLQTGSKIQVRMGYTNNPDKLWPVFTGQVTELEEENGVVTIICQSYMLELLERADDDLKTDGWRLASFGEYFAQKPANLIADVLGLFSGSNADGFFGNITNSLGRIAGDIGSFFTIPRAKAYSGYALWGSDGQTDNVIKDLIKVSNAKHFGHWQIHQGTDPYQYGFRWEQTLGDTIKMLGASSVGTAISLSNDRSGENIMVNHLINVDGTATTGSMKDLVRPYSFQSTLWGIPARYSIPAKPKFPPWVYIKDVSRRFPEYNLMVKQYGYPYGADATLVFAHPLDWYYSRLPLLGEHEMQHPDNKRDNTAFQQWWNATGQARFLAVANDFVGASAAKVLAQNIGGSGGYEAFVDALNAFRNAVNNPLSTNPVTSKLADLFPELKLLSPDVLQNLGVLPGITSLFNPTQMRNQINSVLLEAQTFISSLNSQSLLKATANSRVQPVRRFHFVDSSAIIHNGIKLNDKIFNTVKIGESQTPISTFIPPHHRRMLDCDPLIVNPDENVNGSGLDQVRTCYAQSFLREEVGKMYSGEILLRGIPEIEPWDVLMLTDASTGTCGPVEVDSVIHSFDQEMGMISIVKPRLLLNVNEAATAGMLSKLMNSYGTAKALMYSVHNEWNAAQADAQAGTGNTPTIATGVGTGTALLGSGLLGMFGGTGALLEASLIGGSISGIINQNAKLNALLIVPLMRYGRPYVGGLEGYRVGDMAQLLFDKIKQFNVDEVQPLIDAWRLGASVTSPSLSSVAGPSNLSIPPSSKTPSLNNLSRAITGNDFVSKWAEAIRKHEGTAPTNPSTRNNNPGNLEIAGTANPPRDNRGFARFNTWDEGVAALKQDLRAKMQRYPNFTIAMIMCRYLGGNPYSLPANGLVYVQGALQGNYLTYAQAIASAVGVPVTTQIGTFL